MGSQAFDALNKTTSQTDGQGLKTQNMTTRLNSKPTQ